jgi:hypothetical protein
MGNCNQDYVFKTEVRGIFEQTVTVKVIEWMPVHNGNIGYVSQFFPPAERVNVLIIIEVCNNF